MGLIRAVLGAIVGSYIFYNEGWPLHSILEVIPLPIEYKYPMLIFLVGSVAGLIAGTSIWGIISGIGVFPMALILIYFILPGREFNPGYFKQIIESFGFNRILYLGVGGLIGGLLSASITKSNDYVLLKMKR